MENQPAVVFPSNRCDIKSIQIKHLGMSLVGLEVRRLRFATPGYFANRRKAESWRISSLSFLSFWVVCACVCMFGLDIYVCVFKLTSQRRLHYFNSSPPKTRANCWIKVSSANRSACLARGSRQVLHAAFLQVAMRPISPVQTDYGETLTYFLRYLTLCIGGTHISHPVAPMRMDTPPILERSCCTKMGRSRPASWGCGAAP